MSERLIITAEGAPAAIGPYSHAVAGGGLVFLSGQVGADPVTGDLADGVAAQAEQALRNIAVVLGAARTDLSRVVKATIFLTDMGDFATVNEVYARHVGEAKPARSTVTVAALPKGALVEIEMTALAGTGDGG
jgi:2-iminobutanoate/2-iminopropanoate deaminase